MKCGDHLGGGLGMHNPVCQLALQLGDELEAKLQTRHSPRGIMIPLVSAVFPALFPSLSSVLRPQT